MQQQSKTSIERSQVMPTYDATEAKRSETELRNVEFPMSTASRQVAADALLAATQEVERLRKQLATPLDFGCPTCGATAGQECTYVQGKPRAWWTPTPTSYHAHNRRIDYVDPDVIDDAAIRHAAGLDGDSK